MTQIEWLSDYFKNFSKHLAATDFHQLAQMKDVILKAHKEGNKVIFAGNGGSAAMASHAAVDFTKVAGIRAVNFNEADLITCLANDYGYENWVQKALEFYADPGDVIVLISSSGRSPNMVLGGKYARSKEFPLVTFTGFDKDNELRKLGRLNLWVDSRQYNVVEGVHQAWILSVCDMIVQDTSRPELRRDGQVL